MKADIKLDMQVDVYSDSFVTCQFSQTILEEMTLRCLVQCTPEGIRKVRTTEQNIKQDQKYFRAHADSILKKKSEVENLVELSLCIQSEVSEVISRCLFTVLQKSHEHFVFRSQKSMLTRNNFNEGFIVVYNVKSY